MNIPRWLLPPQLEQQEQTRLARLLFVLLTLILVLEITLILAIPQLFPENQLIASISIGIAFFYTLGCYILLQAGQIKTSSFLFFGLLGALMLGTAWFNNGINSFSIPIFVLVILAAGLVLGTSVSFLFAFLGSVSVMAIFYSEISGLVTPAEMVVPDPIKIAAPIFLFFSSALILAFLSLNYETIIRQEKQNRSGLEKEKAELQNVRTTLEKQAVTRTAHLQASTEIGQIISNIYDLDQLVAQIIKKLMIFFDCEYTAIYFVDPTQQWVTLQYTSQDSSSFPESARRLDISALSQLGTAIRYRKPHIVQITDTADRPDFIVLPDVQSAVAIPLFVAGRLNGILTIQSYKKMAFAPQIDALQNIANQIAIAIENTNLFLENKNLQHEVNRLNQFYLQSTWRDLLTQETPTFHFLSGKVQETNMPDFSALEIAQKEQKVHIRQENGVSTLVSPILFQKQVLGAITLKSSERVWSVDELNLIETVLNQTALSLENTRLFIETRNRAEQEKTLSEISNQMRETLDIETILQTTVREMQKALQLSEVEIHLLPDVSTDIYTEL